MTFGLPTIATAITIVGGVTYGAWELDKRYMKVSDANRWAQMSLINKIELALLKNEPARAGDLCERFIGIYKWTPPICVRLMRN